MLRTPAILAGATLGLLFIRSHRAISATRGKGLLQRPGQKACAGQGQGLVGKVSGSAAEGHGRGTSQVLRLAGEERNPKIPEADVCESAMTFWHEGPIASSAPVLR